MINAMDRPSSVSAVTTGAGISIFSPSPGADSAFAGGAGVTTVVVISIFSPFSFSAEIYLKNGPKASFSSCAAAVA
jgi:hypothetical protein